MKVLTLLFLSLMFVSVCNAENILLSAATTDKELLLLNVEYANKKFKIVDYAIFKLPFQAGLTAVRRLQDGNYQVVWTAQDASKKIKLHRIIVDSNLNKVKNTKKFARVLASHFNLNLVDPDQQSLKAADTEGPFITYSKDFYTVVAEASGILGDPRGGADPLFIPLAGVRPIDTAIANFSIPTAGNYYATLGYADSRDQYVLILGNTSNSQHTSAFGFTAGDVTSIDLVPETGTDNFSLYGWEKLNNPVRYRIWERIFNGITGQPVGPQKTVRITKPGDLGSLASFNPLTVVSSKDQQRVRFAWWSEPEPGLAGTDIYVKSLNDGDKERLAQLLNFDMVGSPNFVRFIYAIDGTNLEPPMPNP